MQGNSKGSRASQKTCMFLQAVRGLLWTHPNRILPFEIILAIISDLGWSISSLVYSHGKGIRQNLKRRVHTESQLFLSQRLFWKDPVLEALDQQDRSWEVVQMGFWAWKLHFFLDQWQMFLSLFAVALVFLSSQSCEIWKTSHSNKTFSVAIKCQCSKDSVKAAFWTKDFNKWLTFWKVGAAKKTKPPKETGDTWWLTHASHSRSQILSKQQKTGIRMPMHFKCFLWLCFPSAKCTPKRAFIDCILFCMNYIVCPNLFACFQRGWPFPWNDSIHGWSSGLGMPQYYDYFIAKGFTYGAKLRWMTRKYLVPWTDGWVGG